MKSAKMELRKQIIDDSRKNPSEPVIRASSPLPEVIPRQNFLEVIAQMLMNNVLSASF